MKLARYARYSSDNQKSESIEEQFREIDEWATERKHQIVASYSDYALSGKYDIRPEFERMLVDAQSPACAWEGVIVFDLSRFSRGGEYGIIDSLKLQEAGKALLSVTESFINANDFGGKLIKHIKFLMAEEKIDELRSNIMRGHKDNAIKAKHNGGSPPLGYDTNNEGNYIINEHEANAVRLIFQMYADLKPYSKICAELNARGYKTKRNGSEFAKNSLHEILKNKKYIGIYEYGKIKRVKLRRTTIDSQKSRILPNPDVIIIEGGCPAIIERSLWDKVQSMKRTKEVYNPLAKVDYLLKGKIICGKCGAKFNGNSKGANKDNYYVCSTVKSKKTCDNRSVSKTTIEKSIAKAIRDALFSEKGKSVLREFIKSYNDKCEGISPEIIENYKRNLQTIEGRLGRAREAYLNGVMELSEYKQTKSDAEKQKAELVIPFENKKLDLLNDEKLDRILINLENSVSSEKDFIDLLVEKVIITGENIDVYIYKSFLFDNSPNNDPKNGGNNSTNEKTESTDDSRCGENCGADDPQPSFSHQNGDLIISFILPVNYIIKKL